VPHVKDQTNAKSHQKINADSLALDTKGRSFLIVEVGRISWKLWCVMYRTGK